MKGVTKINFEKNQTCQWSTVMPSPMLVEELVVVDTISCIFLPITIKNPHVLWAHQRICMQTYCNGVTYCFLRKTASFWQSQILRTKSCNPSWSLIPSPFPNILGSPAAGESSVGPRNDVLIYKNARCKTYHFWRFGWWRTIMLTTSE
jgi:hypothetical protein